MYWGNPDASVSFCEDKYNVLPYVAEYYNTMSAISYIIVGLILKNFTKLKKISNSNFIIQEVLNELIENYKFYFSRIDELDFINRKYNKNIFGKDGCKLIIGGRRQYGKIISISKTGVVKLELDSRGIQEFDPRKIKILYD